MRVSDILRKKSPGVVTVRPEERIDTLAQRLRQEGIGAMVVSRDGILLDGIISERDIAHGVAAFGKSLFEMKVEDLMTHKVVVCGADDMIGDIARTMTNRRIRHLPVLEGKRLIGIVSVGDVIKNRLDELQMEVDVMRDYAIARN